MPLYEYQCAGCGNVLEAIQKFSDEPLTECPECGGRLEKLLSAPAIQFKGSGWYITDYARKSANGEKGGGPASGKGGETKAESPAPESKAAASGTSAAKAEGGGTSS